MNIDDVARNISDIAAGWMPQRSERLARRALDKADFATLAEAGLTLTGVPEEMGGLWRGPERSSRAIAGFYRTLAAADPSVALVATMHPTVLISWLEQPDEPPADADAWREQRERLFSAAMEGCWFGTIASEPGSGGDLMATRTTAAQDADGGWRITGDKHMGSGSGVTSFMLTFAAPEGEDEPDIFLIDARDRPWDGSAGAKLVREWDGYGMAATQSHAFRFEGLPVERHALKGGALDMMPRIMPVGGYMFSSVTMGILDAALAEGRRRLEPRSETMAPFERVSWTKAVNDIWLANQAFEGMGRAMESDAPLPAVQRGKLAIAELAETAMLSISKAVGGGSYSRSSPFGQWLQDVRALGFLRPPWPLAHDRLFEQSFED